MGAGEWETGIFNREWIKNIAILKSEEVNQPPASCFHVLSRCLNFRILNGVQKLVYLSLVSFVSHLLSFLSSIFFQRVKISGVATEKPAGCEAERKGIMEQTKKAELCKHHKTCFLKSSCSP